MADNDANAATPLGGWAAVIATFMAAVTRLSDRLTTVEHKVSDHDSYGPRLAAVEQAIRRIDEHLSEQDRASQEQSAAVLHRLDDLEEGRRQNMQAIDAAVAQMATIDAAVAQMATMTKNVEMLNTTFRGSVDHRRETNRKVVETVENLAKKVERLEQVRADEEAAAQRCHAETLAQQQAITAQMNRLTSGAANTLKLVGPGVAVALITAPLIGSGYSPALRGYLPLLLAAAVVLGLTLFLWRYIALRWRRRRLQPGDGDAP